MANFPVDWSLLEKMHVVFNWPEIFVKVEMMLKMKFVSDKTHQEVEIIFKWATQIVDQWIDVRMIAEIIVFNHHDSMEFPNSLLPFLSSIASGRSLKLPPLST